MLHLNKIALFVVVVFLYFSPTIGTHFRAGSITWRVPDATKPNEIEFIAYFTFRRSYFGNPVIGSIVNPGTFSFGHGSSKQLYLNVTNINIDADWLAGVFISTYTYPEYPANYTAMHSSAGRMLELNNNPNKNWNVTSVVNVMQKVKDKNNIMVYNTSPVSSSVPIFYVAENYLNTFQVLASDPEGVSIEYLLATPQDLGGTSHTLVPNLSVNSSTGIVTFNTSGIPSGLWCSQIKFSDGLSYSVHDFLISVGPKPKACSLTCDTKGIPCSSDSDCACGIGSCQLAEPPYFIPPTPTNGAIYTAFPNQPLSFNWTAFTPNGNNLTIVTSSLPLSSYSETSSSGPYFTHIFTWTPTLTNVGIYVISLDCTDSTGARCTTQPSFVINIERPFCESGVISPVGCEPASGNCSCICNEGFDIETNCYDCLPNHYGHSCVSCQCNDNGVCDDGVVGIGCVCNVGWKGENCSDSLGLPCDPSHSYIVSNISSGTFVNPSTIYTYLANEQLDLIITTRVLAAPSKLDILFLVDVTKSITSTMFSYLLNSTSFLNSVRALVPNSYFGLATFTDLPTGPGCSAAEYPFRIHSPLSLDTVDFRTAANTYLVPTVLGCNDTASKNDSQLNALILATQQSVGWRQDSYRTIIMVTDSPFWEGTSGYANRSELLTALVSQNIVPIFLSPLTVQPVYTSLASYLNFGVAATISAGYNNVLTVALTEVQTLWSSLTAVVNQDEHGVVVSPQGSYKQAVSGPANATVIISVKHPNITSINLSSLPDIKVTLMGYGSTRIIPLVNQAPTSVDCYATTRKGIPVGVGITGSDPDGNALTIVLTTLPLYGSLTQNQSSSVNLTSSVAYTIPDGIYAPFLNYVPDQRWWGVDSFTYYLSDGCSSTETVSCTINVTFFDYPPVSLDVIVNTTENNDVLVAMNAYDIETNSSELEFIITSLPGANLGILIRESSNTSAVVDEWWNPGENIMRFVPAPYMCCEPVFFSYMVRDSSGQVSSSSVTIYIIGVNQVPYPSAQNISVIRGTTTPMTLNVWDPDNGDEVTFVITSITGNFSLEPDTPVTTVPFNLSTVPIINWNASAIVYYNAPLNQTGDNVASITFYVVDLMGAASDPITAFISIRSNSIPSAIQPDPIIISHNSNSSLITLGGTDDDAADNNTLKVLITILPKLGILSQFGVGDINPAVSVPFELSISTNIYYHAIEIGEDSFEFCVVDLLGATSLPLNVSIIILPPIFHAPFILPVANTTAVRLVPQNITIIINDDDVNDNITLRITSFKKVGTLKIGTTQINDQTMPFILPNVCIISASNLCTIILTYTALATAIPGEPDTLNFMVVDQTGLSSNVTSIYISIAANNAPTANPAGPLIVQQDFTSNEILLSGTDADAADLASLVVVIVSLPTKGRLFIGNTTTEISVSNFTLPSNVSTTVSYATTQRGLDSFDFAVRDQLGALSLATRVTISITNTNHAPNALFSASSITAYDNETITITQIQASDPDDGDDISIWITQAPTVGTISQLDGTKCRIPCRITDAQFRVQLTLVPNSNKNFSFFTFEARDSFGKPSAPVTATIGIIALPRPNACSFNNGGCDYRVQCFNNNEFVSCGPCPNNTEGNGRDGCKLLCGNDVCSASETCVSCPIDCGYLTCGTCGDSKCDTGLGENCLTCPEDCGLCVSPTCERGCIHGVCINGQCKCSESWSGPSCSSRNEPIVFAPNTQVPNVVITAGIENARRSRSLLSTNTSFSISVKSITEVKKDFTDVTEPFSLLNVDFSFVEMKNGNNTKYNYSGTLENSAEITIIMWKFEEPSTIQFAGETTSYAPHTLKINVQIANWPFQSLDNSLLITMDSQSSNSDCFNQNEDTSNLRWFVASLDGVNLYGQFLDKAVIDGRTRKINFMLNSDKTVSAVLPHFWSSADMDPNYSVLLGGEDSNSDVCGKEESKPETTKTKNRNLVIIIVPVVVGAVLLAVVGIYLSMRIKTRLQVRKGRRTVRQSKGPTEMEDFAIEKRGDMEVNTSAQKYVVKFD